MSDYDKIPLFLAWYMFSCIIGTVVWALMRESHWVIGFILACAAVMLSISLGVWFIGSDNLDRLWSRMKKLVLR